MSIPASIADLRLLAQRRLPRILFDYIDGGAGEEVTMTRNLRDLQEISLRQRVMRDVSQLHVATTIVGQPVDQPVVLGPVGLAGMYARRGEVQAARAAAANGVPFCLSTMSVCSLTEVAAATGLAPWFQLYMIKDRACMADLLALAASRGSPVLVLTVDLPVAGIRNREIRNGGLSSASRWMRVRSQADGLAHAGWLWDVFVNGRPHTLGNLAVVQSRRMTDFWAWIRMNFDPAVTWRDLDWVRKHWHGPLVLKGILEVEDAVEAARLGVDGIVVSNHGGRQLDGTLSTARALPPIAQAVGDKLDVLVDGGIRSGADVLKSLALGAKACLLGRAWAFALAAAGEKGVCHMLAKFRSELMTTMALTGCSDVRHVPRGLLAT